MNVSVCMCSYNGERYIAKQIESVLLQLRSGDELIICDDGSTDSTIALIEGLATPQITLERNPSRLGVIGNFGKCIQLSTKEVVFLADQDDVWLPGKVNKVTRIFMANPDVTLVLSNAQVIDGEDCLVAERYLHLRHGSQCSIIRALCNLAKNQYLGCAMAFKREMLDYCLPFPTDIPMHDMWIGIVNDIYGKTFYLDEPLIRHRQHGSNASPSKHTSIWQMLKWRSVLIKNLSGRVLGHGFGRTVSRP